jgi:molybdopterin synthase catalytic subunit
MALRMLNRIADEIAERFGVERLAIVHRVGDVPLGDVSIAVVAVSPHRDAAFLAAKYAIDETKGRVPIWKAERFEDGHVWIGEPARAVAPPPTTSDRPTPDGTPARLTPVEPAPAPGTPDRPTPADAR